MLWEPPFSFSCRLYVSINTIQGVSITIGYSCEITIFDVPLKCF